MAHAYSEKNDFGWTIVRTDAYEEILCGFLLYVSCICVIVQLHVHCIYANVKAFWAVLCIAALYIPNTV